MRVGAIVNPTSVDARFRHLADLLATAGGGVQLQRLFGPEHGVRGESPVHGASGRPVARPRRHRCAGAQPLRFDGRVALSQAGVAGRGSMPLVFDIQDVGSRYYTYIYTMALAMKAAAAAKVRFHVLDRPNPIGGTRVEGNLLPIQKYRSFVRALRAAQPAWADGRRAGADLFNDLEDFRCDLQVVQR